jgi:hypothetical protein
LDDLGRGDDIGPVPVQQSQNVQILLRKIRIGFLRFTTLPMHNRDDEAVPTPVRRTRPDRRNAGK